MAYATTSSSLTARMLRAARLEVNLYEEVEADVNATGQALTVVLIAALASGIGEAIGSVLRGHPAAIVGGLIGGIVSALLGWAVLSYVIYFVGTRLFGGTATYGEMLRTLGFAQSPGVLQVLRFIPLLGGVVALIVLLWTMVTSFIAVRQGLDLDTVKTFLVIIVGLIALFIVYFFVGLVATLLFGAGVFVGGFM